MRTRELRVVETEHRIGAVGVDDAGAAFFTDAADDVFDAVRRRSGDDDKAVADLLDDGWSNGYLYLAPEEGASQAAAARGRELDLLGVGTRALGRDVTAGHDQLHHYWTHGEGLAKWIDSPTQWTTLEHLLEEHVSPGQAKRMAAAWVHEVTGNWPGSDAHRVAEGGKPRGNTVGPG